MDYPIGWEEHNGFLCREFTVSSFVTAVEFINSIVPLAEAMNHHPDIDLHDYKKVTVKLRTHSADAITTADVELAQKINLLD